MNKQSKKPLGTIKDTKEIQDLFYKFLVENHVLFQFHNYIGRSLEEHCNSCFISQYITDMRSWVKTKEGANFWHELDLKWRKRIRYRIK